MCARDRVQARIQALVQDLQAEALDLQAVQEYLQASSKFLDIWLEHQGNKRVA